VVQLRGPRRNRLGKQSIDCEAQREIEKFYGRYKMFGLAKELIHEKRIDMRATETLKSSFAEAQLTLPLQATSLLTNI
jgi:hypothetical protein